jgi:hypothetical protein
MAFAQAHGREFTGMDLVDHFEELGETVKPSMALAAVMKLCAKGLLVRTRKLAEPHRLGASLQCYAIADVASKVRAEEDAKNAAEGARLAAKQAAEQEAARAAKRALLGDARTHLEGFLAGREGEFYGLSSLARGAISPMPDILEALAQLTREGSLEFATADGEPVWRSRA